MDNRSQWIAAAEELRVPVIVKRFALDRPRGGKIAVTGLGWYRLTVNGRRVTENRFTPALTDYLPRDRSRWLYPLYDITTNRILYNTYDLTPYLRDGGNELELTLADGWFRQKERTAEGDLSFGDALIARFACEIETAAGTVAVLSDGTETCRACEIVRSDLFLGEEIDGTFNPAAAPSFPVRVIPAPKALLTEQDCPPDRVIRTLAPTLLGVFGDRAVYDAGENISGVLRVTAGGAYGKKITFRFAEERNADGTLNFATTGSGYTCACGRPQIQEDAFTLTDAVRDYEPEFVWHGFRYFDTEEDSLPYLRAVTVGVIHTEMAVTSSFSSDSEGLNFLYDAFVRTLCDNFHGCIPSDCPHRERLGYTGDGQATAAAGMLLLDSRGAYRKWIADILDSQDVLSGHIGHTAPLMGGGGGPGGWGCAVVIVPHEYWKRYGDTETLRECYPAMRKWVGYLKCHTRGGIVTSEEEGGWCLGDWTALGGVQLPAEFVNTCYLLDTLNRLGEIAAVLGEDADTLNEWKKTVRAAMKREYYEPDTGSWCGGTQGADAFALWCGLADDARTYENLRARYERIGHFDTGFLGTGILAEVLARHGEADLLYKLLTTEEKGSFLYMKRHGATALWESFDGGGSHCHHMFGGAVRTLFTCFLGISYEGDRLHIDPHLPAALNRIKGSVETKFGRIEIEVTRDLAGTR